jgi:hypothetical protein
VSAFNTGPVILPVLTVELSETRTTVKFVPGTAIETCFSALGK